VRLLIRWLITAVSVAVAAFIVPGITIDPNRNGIVVVLVMALILGLVNAFVRPILTFLSCGLIVVTLGLFMLVINTLTLALASWLSTQFGFGFYIDGFFPAFFGAIVISIVSFVLSLFLPDDNR
jgi:putative membrane protein